jgi:heme-degrading monooxygenase HmoA
MRRTAAWGGDKMYARVTNLTLNKGKAEEAVRIYETSILPAAKAQKGYRGSYVLADWEAGKGIVLTFWESEKDATANEENRYYQEQLIKVMRFFAAPPIREGYDVAVDGR